VERTSVDDAPAASFEDGAERRDLAAALGVDGFACNRYRVPPGTGLPGGLHAHADQAETFVVLAGTATFHTPEEAVTVAAGGAVRFAPGEFQTGRNEADEPLVVLALGAPPDAEDFRLPVACPACPADELRLRPGGPAFECPDCGLERVPADCPACGGADLAVRPGADGVPVVRCGDCGATFERPPVEGGW